MCCSFRTSAGDTSRLPRICRFDFVVLLVRMWRLNALARMIFPVPVFLKRLAAPRCVFNLGILGLSRFSLDRAAVLRYFSAAAVGAGAAAGGFGFAVFRPAR
jgi:hypothetical protein